MGLEGKETKKESSDKKHVHGSESTSDKASDAGSKSRHGWRDVFDNLTYSGGPGDNIYVFG